MDADHTIEIGPDGNMRFIYSDELRPLMDMGDVDIRRASHVEPNEDGQWTADLSPVGGGVSDPFDTREEALKFERDWLLEHRTPTPNEASNKDHCAD